ncbi:disease resistance protein RFL1-like [Vigna unguiculata]|uniref:disease resistance protein RFL1-like n=1 Tax=Vigna unguiculata TaxID=3917 RepID=UPI0010169AC8|nr:disease resistance protein RFL1-like [Vigna unguiculata]
MEPKALRLKDECPKDEEVSHAENVTSFDLTSSYSGYIEFDSRKSIVQDIMRKLKDPNIKIIGLHGAQGMGKSTLIKKIANKAKDEGLFDRVAEIDVTVNPNPLTIQADIAHVLGLPLVGESENVRADYLRRWLKIENVSILIILDNLHERLDLNRLGIPVDLDYDLRKKNELSIMSSNQGTNPNPGGGAQGTGEKVLKKGNFLGDYKGCKVLLSSRDKKVFHDEVDVESNFCLKELDGNDALMLFEKVIGGGNKMSMPKEEIQNYCTGLPMRIVTFGVAFKNWIESESKPTLDKFKKQGLVEWQKSSETPNKKKYDLPKNKELKFIYLLCAQMGHLPLVNDLVKYCFGLGIFEGVSSLSAAREKINESIQELKNLSLVSYENPNIHFHMSHMVRDDALSNALMDHNVFALRDGKLDYWPDLEKCISISICNSYITDGFPQVINCPQLKFLQIETNDPSLEIPQRFFSSMKNLLVLILTDFHLSSLPYSIKDLLNLRMLCLERCTLDCNLSVLRKFKKLRILSFSGSQLKNLPVELRYLDKLRMLDISDCFKLKIIPPDLFSNLRCLEELYIRKSLIKMLVEKGENKGHNSFLSELKNLHQLKVVDLSIPCVSILPSHLFFDRLKDYKIEIGDFEMFSVGEFRMPNKYEELKVLALQLKDDTDLNSHQGIKLLFKTAQSLFLGNVCVQNVLNELNIDGFQNLKHLSIINNNDVEYFNSTDLSYCVNIFSNLESLWLCNMMNLKMICRGPITLESFAKLKTIKVEMCCQLENLFSFYAIKISTSTGTSEIFKCNSIMKKFLASLEMIEVCECESLKEILQIPLDCGEVCEVCECESLKEILQIPQDYGKVEFLKLRTLTLQSLPSFTCFYTKVERSCWPHLTEAQTTNWGHTEISTEQDGHSDNAPPLFGELV